jgi:Sulfotransferase family
MRHDGPRIFFIHVMKTAGGSLLQQIIANYREDEIYPRPANDVDILGANYEIGYLLSLPAERRNRIRIFTGHFPYATVEMLGIEVATITILRDPVARTISYLRHCKKRHSQHRQLRLEEIYEDPMFFPFFIHNHQAKQFALTAADNPQSYMDVLEVDESRLKLAKANLEKVDVIGLQESYDELLVELALRFGWNRAPVEDRNVGRRGKVSRSFKARIAEDNAMDMEFYEHAVQLVERRRAAKAVG